MTADFETGLRLGMVLVALVYAVLTALAAFRFVAWGRQVENDIEKLRLRLEQLEAAPTASQCSVTLLSPARLHCGPLIVSALRLPGEK